MRRLAVFLLPLALSSACSCDVPPAADGGSPADAGPVEDGGLLLDAGTGDAGLPDAGAADAGEDGGLDAGPADGGLVDAGGDGGASFVDAGEDGGSPDAGLAPDEVQIVIGDVAYLPDGSVFHPRDGASPELWEETDAGLVQRTVSPQGGGAYLASGVSPGASYFVRTSPLSTGWHHSSARELSLVSPNTIGRIDAPFFEDPIPADLELTGLVATGANTELLLYCPGVGSSFGVLLDPGVSQGSEALTGTGLIQPVSDGAFFPEGETCRLVQRVRESEVPSLDVARAESAPFVLTLDASGRAALAAALTPVPHDVLTLVLDADEATATAAAFHPLGNAPVVGTTLIPKPWAPAGLWPDYFDPILEQTRLPFTGGAHLLDLPRPFADLTGGNVLIASLSTTVPLRLPGTTLGGVTASYDVAVDEDGAGSFSVDVAPSPSHLATDLRVDGEPATDGGTLASREPLVSWTPPASGDAFGYQVQALRLLVSGPGTTARGAGSVWTQATSVRLPPGILDSGESYVLRVRAYRGAATAPGSAPVRARLELPQQSAAALTGIYVAP